MYDNGNIINKMIVPIYNIYLPPPQSITEVIFIVIRRFLCNIHYLVPVIYFVILVCIRDTKNGISYLIVVLFVYVPRITHWYIPKCSYINVTR